MNKVCTKNDKDEEGNPIDPVTYESLDDILVTDDGYCFNPSTIWSAWAERRGINPMTNLQTVLRKLKAGGKDCDLENYNLSIGGFGDAALAECPTPDGIAAEISTATTFEAGFSALVKAGLAGLAMHVLQPLLDDLQDRFLNTTLKQAVSTGKNSPCAPLEPVDVTYTRLFDDPNPEWRKRGGPRERVDREAHYRNYKDEPFAVARNLFSDILDENNPVPHLTPENTKEIQEYLAYRTGNSVFHYLEAASHLIPPKDKERIDAMAKLIKQRFKDVGADYYAPQLIYATGTHALTGYAHYDNGIPDTVTAIIPITETLATTMNNCDDAHGECLMTGAEDAAKAPLLQPGDAQFFRGVIHMHAGNNLRKTGSMYFLLRLDDIKFPIEELIRRLALERSETTSLFHTSKKTLD